jgi:hypothetical protein
MRTLSATASVLEPSDATTSANTIAFGASGPTADEKGTSFASPASGTIPTFGPYDRVAYAIESRRAGRLNAANISEDEYHSLLRERQSLLDKKFEGTIKRKESNRLQYVRWSLARIEDSRSGPALDVLESLVTQYEQFHRDVESLSDTLSKQMTGKRGDVRQN